MYTFSDKYNIHKEIRKIIISNLKILLGQICMFARSNLYQPVVDNLCKHFSCVVNVLTVRRFVGLFVLRKNAVVLRYFLSIFFTL